LEVFPDAGSIRHARETIVRAQRQNGRGIGEHRWGYHDGKDRKRIGGQSYSIISSSALVGPLIRSGKQMANSKRITTPSLFKNSAMLMLSNVS
jgi:hypothetical protein